MTWIRPTKEEADREAAILVGASDPSSISKESATEFYQQVKAASLPYMPTKAKRTDWETPRDFFDSLWKEFGGFDMDPACDWLENGNLQYTAHMILRMGGRVCVPSLPSGQGYQFIDKRILQDGLMQPWEGKVFLNPPYGRGELEPWIEKAVKEVSEGEAEKVVALLPARTGTKWWQKYVLREVYKAPYEGIIIGARSMKATLVRFLPGRLTFEGAKDCAPFPSVIVVWSK